MKGRFKTAVAVLTAGLGLLAIGVLLTAKFTGATDMPWRPNWGALLTLMVASCLVWVGGILTALGLARRVVALVGAMTVAGSFVVPWSLHALGVTWLSNYNRIPALTLFLAGLIQLAIAAFRSITLASSHLISSLFPRVRRRGLWAGLGSALILALLALPIYLCATIWGYQASDLVSTLSVSARYEWDSTHGVRAFHVAESEIGDHAWGRIWQLLVGLQIKPQLDAYLRHTPWQEASGAADVYVLMVIPFALPGAWGSEGLTVDANLTPLMRAVDNGDVNAVRRLLAEGANVNAKDRWGRTALIHACGHGCRNEALVTALLQAGADANASDLSGDTPLTACIIGGVPETRTVVIRTLLRAGTKVNATGVGGNTPLMTAATNGKLDVVRDLLAAGADVNRENIRGESALMMAGRGGHEDIVRALIKNGADVNAKDKEGRTALSSAVDAGYGDVVRLLKQRGAHD
jgi:Ankyrin repeats (3 copies)/Ankyrin repeats (many copies)